MRSKTRALSLLPWLVAPGCQTANVGSQSNASILPGNDYYVDPISGSDAATGSQSAPWKTIAKALPQLHQGDTLHLRANSVYPKTIFGQLKGAFDAPITIEPYDGAVVVFDPSVRLPPQSAPPAWVHVACPAGQWCPPDEWMTASPLVTDLDKQTPDDTIENGQLLLAKVRLMSYSRSEDFRATNTSFSQNVALSDPRPAGGEKWGGGKPTGVKVPWTYFGPGIFFVADSAPGVMPVTGRVHIRLTPAQINVPGIQEYAGDTNPNHVGIALTPRNTIAAEITGSQYVIFKNVAFQNGGKETLRVTNSQHLKFDHCQVYGGRWGTRISPDTNGVLSDVLFKSCLFDGGVAPWTMRSELKDNYQYKDSSTGAIIDNQVSTRTNQSLVISTGDDIEYDACTFQHSHDAIALVGRNPSIHGSLFQDINDEAVSFPDPKTPGLVINGRIYQNVFRQVLDAISFSESGNPNGPIYVYRNLFDERIPTRGYRILPPDAPAPFVWRNGADFKMNEGKVGIPELYAYQNTFIVAHGDIRQYQSSFWTNTDFPNPRQFLNNIHVGLDLDEYYSPALNDSRFQSLTNIWYQPHRSPSTAKFPPGGGANWELGSQYVDPLLATLDDEYFVKQEVYQNTDFRPTANSPAIGKGTPLPAAWPDPLRVAGAPDIGALPYGSGPLAVGVDHATLFPPPGLPRAVAGPDVTVSDQAGDGFEAIVVNGSKSTDADGSIVSYVWFVDDVQAATGVTATLNLAEGSHYVRLQVTDNSGLFDTDGLRATVTPATAGNNLLRCPGFEGGACGWQLSLGDASVVQSSHSGSAALQLTTSSGAQATQQVLVHPGSSYTVSGWMRPGFIFGGAGSLTAQFFDAQGAAVGAPIVVGNATGFASQYAYSEKSLVAPATAVRLRVVLATTGGVAGGCLFDDMRVRDHNLLHNGTFELSQPDGSGAVGWTIEATKAAITIDPANVYDGFRAAMLASPGPNEYRFVKQQDRPSTATKVRVSAVLKTIGIPASDPKQWPQVNLLFGLPNGQHTVYPGIADVSEGVYKIVQADVTAPSGVTSVGVELLLNTTPGIAYIDDVLVEPLN